MEVQQTSSEPKVSIVTTTYKRPELLKRAISSVIKQSFKDWELIIVDDCSPDNTEEVVRQFIENDKRISYFKMPNNFGQHTGPKNKGTELAKAELIAYLDDDNTWRMNHLSALIEAFEATGADLVYGDRMIVSPEGVQKGLGVNIEQVTNGQEKHFNLNVICQRNYIDTNDVLLKKSILNEIGGWDDKCKRFADWNLFVRIGKLGKKIIRVPQVITDYYLYPDSNQLRHQSFMFDTIGCPVYINDTQPKRVAIFTITKDRKEYTERMIASIMKFTNAAYDHYFVDNGSTDGTVELLKNLKETGAIKDVIFNKKNVGISKASNQALDLISNGYDYILKVDNDCEFITPNWLENLLEYMNMCPKSLVGPYVEGLVNNPGGAIRVQYGTVGKFLFGAAFHVGGICNIAPANLYKEFRWNVDDRLHDEQDLVLSKYAGSQGYQLGYLEEVKVLHMDNTIGQANKYPDYFELRKKEKTTRYAEDKDAKD